MIAVAPADDVGDAVFTRQVCSRVYYVAAGGFCIDVAGALGIARRGWILDSQLEPVREVKLDGFPTRTQGLPRRTLRGGHRLQCRWWPLVCRDRSVHDDDDAL